jgi:aromatic-L-amino-acid decarboxylase
MDRSLRLLGMGTECKVMLETDARLCVQSESLVRELEARRGEPMIVHLLAGEINTGAFDEFEALIPVAHEHGAWVHVDGAFGLWAQATPSLRHLCRGIELADSWATDAHKWLNVPYDSGLAIVAHPDSHRASMSQTASYLVHAHDVRDQLDYVPEFSRRARGPAIYAALRELGRDGVADLVERCCRHARELVVQIGRLPGAEAVWVPTLNQGLVRFRDTKAGASEADHARRTDAMIERIVADGEVFFRGVDWRGQRCMRVSVSNWRTNESDVARAVAAVKRALG